jgi:hypothetical protein
MRRMCITLFVAILASVTARAELNGNDDFSGPELSTNRWSQQYGLGACSLTQTNQHLLYFSTGSPTPRDVALRVWQPEVGDFDKDWTVQLDVAIPSMSFQTGQGVQIALFALRADAALSNSNAMTVFLGAGYDFRGFESGIFVGGVKVDSESADSASTAGAVRLRWQAASHTLTAEYDADGAAEGYNWTSLVSRTIGPEAFDWGMSATSKFQVGIFGNSQNLQVQPSDGVSADNFICYPRLRVRPGAGTVVLSWSTNAAGFALQARSPIVQSQSWTNFSQSPGIVGSEYQIEDAVAIREKGYRLRR